MMDGPIPPFGLAPFEFGSEFSVPSHLRHNAENFKAPGSREFRLPPPPLSSIFSREFLSKQSAVDDTRHMAGNLEIADLQEDELPGMMPAMSDSYINSTSSSLGCTPPQQSGLHTTLTGLHPPNFLQDSGVSDDGSYPRDSHRDSFAQFGSSAEYGLKSEALSDSRFHLNAPPTISTMAALQAPKMRSIYGPNLNPTFTDAPTPPSMYNYFHQNQPNDTHKASQFYPRPFQGFPFDPSDGVGTASAADHGFQEKDTRGFGSSLGQRSSNEPRQKHAPPTHGDSHDVEDVEDTNRCKNTVEGTKTSVRRFKKWYKDKFGKSVDMNAVTRQMAVELLKDFFLEIRDTRPGKEGNEYEPVTLTTYRNGLRRYFLERKVPPALENFDLADREFDVVNYGLVTKRNELKRKGKGNHPNVVESITEEQLERMWASGAIGVHAPRPLLRLQWWINTVSHGIRGRMAHHDLSIDDFRISRGPDGKIIIDHAKAGSKRPRADDEKETSRSKKKCKARVVATDGGERDPVRAFEVYLRHRPPGISSFYLTPKHKPKGDIWFNKVPMGKNSIGRIMREIKAIAGIG